MNASLDLDMNETASLRTGKRKGIFRNLPGHVLLGIFSALCVLPLLLVLSISFSNNDMLYKHGYSLIPKVVSIEAYDVVFKNSYQLASSYLLTVFVTITGTFGGLWLTSSLGYVLSRKDYAYKKATSIYVLFSMLFNGGLTANYIWIVRGLHLQDNVLVLILPIILNPYNILLAKGFFMQTPVSIVESAKIDGSGEMNTFIKIILPISKPALTTIGLFLALAYWNDWFMSLMYINNNKTISLQFLLYRVMQNINFLANLSNNMPGQMFNIKVPTLSARMVICVLAAGPMLFVFPFFQKYFIKGIVMGSVKG